PQVLAAEEGTERIGRELLEGFSPQVPVVLRPHFIRLAVLAAVMYVPVGENQIGPAVQFAVDELRPKAEHLQAAVAETEFGGFVGVVFSGNLRNVKRVRLIVKVGDEELDETVAVRIFRGDTHASLSKAIAVVAEPRLDGTFAEAGNEL